MANTISCNYCPNTFRVDRIGISLFMLTDPRRKSKDYVVKQFAHSWNLTCCQYTEKYSHYIDVIMTTMASQITSLMVVYSTVYFQTQIKEYIKAPRHWPLYGVPVNSAHKGPVTRKMFPFDDVIMEFPFHTSIRQWQAQAVQCKFIPTQNRLTVALNVWYRSAGAVPIRFWRVGQGQVGRTLGTTLGDGRCLWDSEARVRNWTPTREAISSELEFTLLPVHRDVSSFISSSMFAVVVMCSICWMFIKSK